MEAPSGSARVAQTSRRSEDADVLIVGGGAAGYFAAIACARARPDLRVVILEGAAEPLAKVRISGGGRCNLTHDCPAPRQLVRHYPRGGRALLGPFHRFGPADTIAFFGAEGVATKTEADGRMFPVSDRSESVIVALTGAAQRAGVVLRTHARVDRIEAGPPWVLHTKAGARLEAHQVLIACGASPAVWRQLAALGLAIVEPVPSLFSFNTKDPRLAGLAGLSVPNAAVRVDGTKLADRGPLLVTHWGLSGPAILRLSAWGARALHAVGHRFDLEVRWVDRSDAEVDAAIAAARGEAARKRVANHCPVGLPSRLWQSLVGAAGIGDALRWAELSKASARALHDALTRSRFRITGKSTNKDEFVTAGGVDLEEIDFRRFAARRLPGLYLAGEVLDIDAVTGGFNFQAAWTGGWIAGHAMAEVGRDVTER